MRQKKIAGIIIAICLFSVSLIGIQLSQKHQIAYALGGGLQDYVTAYWDDGKGNIVRDPATDLPTYIVFNPGTDHYNAYGKRKLWEHQHMGCYVWYTLTEPIPHKQTTKESIDYSRIIENRAERSSLDYEWLVERKKGIYQNLKLGSKIPNKHGYDSFLGENTGTTLIVNPSKYEGKYYEWRYLGYSSNGVIIENPFFPPDYPNDNFDPLKKDWWYRPWEKGYGHPQKLKPSSYDADPERDPQAFQR